MADRQWIPDVEIPRHPCFDAGAAGRYGRIHLPVAPACNIQCRYCNRVYDCSNENRPGVTSRLLDPEEALAHLDAMLAQMPCTSVVGIAGPGDSLADPERTFLTLEHIRRKHSRLHLCLSTNGLVAAQHVGTLVDLDVRYVTVTVNAVDARVGKHIIHWVTTEQRRLEGLDAAACLIDRQMEAIGALKAVNRVLKVNTVVIPGVNDAHAVKVAAKVSRLKADLHNLIELIPLAGTEFFGTPPLSPGMMRSLRKGAESFLPQMRHCVRCRSDAAGLLHDNRPEKARGHRDDPGSLGDRKTCDEARGFHARGSGRGHKDGQQCSTTCR